jgi:hypothetical protein
MFGHDSQQNNAQPDQAPASPTFSPSDAVTAPTTGAATSDVSTAATPDPVKPTLPAMPATSSPGLADDDLLSIKQAALQQLSPLVGHLEQSPEEKFRTTMMMIQAADDQTLIKTAYAAAKDIADEKARAQALLDIVNEINYFTQQHAS